MLLVFSRPGAREMKFTSKPARTFREWNVYQLNMCLDQGEVLVASTRPESSTASLSVCPSNLVTSAIHLRQWNSSLLSRTHPIN
jgi:hypothetical protein